MIHSLGPRTGRIFDLLQDRILSGELKPGARLPPHTRLAADFGVAPMTMRNVLARLEAAGLVSRELGRGTFVRGSATLMVLALAGAHLQEALGEHLRRNGHPLITAGTPAEALSVLESSRSIGLVLCELEVAGAASVAEFIRGVRRRWPRVPVAVITASAADLAVLHGAPECPVLLLPTPLRLSQVEEVLRMALADTSRLAAPSLAAQRDEHTDLTALRFRARLLEAVEQAVIATDMQARILYWNRGAERLYGWSAEEVLGRNVAEIIVAPKLMERGLEIMARLREGKSWTGEFAVSRRDGIQIPVLVTDSPLRDADGQLVGIIGVAVDLSERKQAERERFERVRLEALLLATEATQGELSQQLALHVPFVGRLASDPRLPSHLRPIAGVVLDTVREVATRLERAADLSEAPDTPG